MRNKKILLAAVILLCGVAFIAGNNRPYRWWPINDMYEQDVLLPFRDPNALIEPPEGSVAVDQWDVVLQRTEIDAAGVTNPVPSSPESIAEGQWLSETYCFTCHGNQFRNDPEHQSPVQAKGMPGANLDLIKMRSDGWIFSTMTHGSAIMKRMSYHLSPEERWHVVNYIRDLASKSE